MLELKSVAPRPQGVEAETRGGNMAAPNPSAASARPSPIAGQWYADDPEVLAQRVDGYLAAAAAPPDADVLGVIVPHAGHRFSGGVAGAAFGALRGLTPEIVALVGPLHYPARPDLLTSAHPAYQTPLGEVPVDQAVLAELASLIPLTFVANDSEHSLEIELPFLQRALAAPFRLLPLMMRAQSAAAAQALGAALAQVLAGLSALLVASSDLSHFYSQAEAVALDARLLARLAAYDPAGLIAAAEAGHAYACGYGPMAAVLWAAQARGATAVEVVQYATSGDITGDRQRVVGYAAALITRPRPASSAA
jgi:AmmeMemoRadiSam system protein B